MPAFAWALIWVGLTLVGLAYLGWLAYRLLVKAKAALAAAEPVIAKLEEFSRVASLKPDYKANPDNLLDAPVPHIQEQLRLRKVRNDKAAERQRRLRNKLIDFDVNESEFKNEP